MAAKRSVPKRPKRTVKPYRKYGFHSQKAYDNWIKRWSSVPESDPRYFRRTLRGHSREAEIPRLKRVIRRTHSDAKEIRRKKNLLVDTMDKMSPFNFLDRYKDQMNALLHDKNTSDYDKKILRQMFRQLHSDIGVDPNIDVAVDEQLRLFR